MYMANLGIWDAIDSAGPACGTRTTEPHVERCPRTLQEFLGEVTA